MPAISSHLDFLTLADTFDIVFDSLLSVLIFIFRCWSEQPLSVFKFWLLLKIVMIEDDVMRQINGKVITPFLKLFNCRTLNVGKERLLQEK